MANMIPAGSSVPVQFIMCTEEQIQKMKSKNYLSLTENQKETNINLNLEKEPEEDPIENLIKELENI